MGEWQKLEQNKMIKVSQFVSSELSEQFRLIVIHDPEGVWH